MEIIPHHNPDAPPYDFVTDHAWTPKFIEKNGRKPADYDELRAFMDAEDFIEGNGRAHTSDEELKAFKDAQLEESMRDTEQHYREAMLKCDAKLRAAGKTFAWCKPEPTYAPTCSVFVRDRLMWRDIRLNTPHGEEEPYPTQPCQITTWFSLAGGGRVGVVERWEWRRASKAKELAETYRHYRVWKDDHTCLWKEHPKDGHRLIVQAHTADGLYRCEGLLFSQVCEMSFYAAVFNGSVPQEIVDRVAKTLGAIDWEDTYYALLDSSQGCAMCGRPLRDEVSQLVGVGPDCAKKHHIPHSVEAANGRLEIRRKILGEIEQAKH